MLGHCGSSSGKADGVQRDPAAAAAAAVPFLERKCYIIQLHGSARLMFRPSEYTLSCPEANINMIHIP